MPIWIVGGTISQNAQARVEAETETEAWLLVNEGNWLSVEPSGEYGGGFVPDDWSDDDDWPNIWLAEEQGDDQSTAVQP